MQINIEKKEMKAYAKVNLFLKVEKPDKNNYHPIKTIFQPLCLSDNIIIEKGKENGVKLTSNKDIPLDEKNSVYKAIKLMCEETKTKITDLKLNIHIEKQIPLSAGLGGSAVDAAPIMKELRNQIWKDISDSKLLEIAAKIGADVPQAFYKEASYAEGYGDRILKHFILPHKYVCIYTPKEYMTKYDAKTKVLYNMIDIEKSKIKDKIKDNEIINKLNKMKYVIKTYDWKEIGKYMHNDFELVAFKFYPILRRIKEKMLECGAYGALLAGSGGSVFGVFETPQLSFDASCEIEKMVKKEEIGNIILTEIL